MVIKQYRILYTGRMNDKDPVQKKIRPLNLVVGILLLAIGFSIIYGMINYYFG